MKLLEILTEQTQSLKTQYVEKSINWASDEFERLRTFAQEYREGKHGFGAASKKYHAIPYEVHNNKKDLYLQKVEKLAVRHYENSIIKLAARIEKRGLNQDNLSVKTAHVGVNIDTVLTDGNKTVHAYTIMAWGPIQRPHYRYLIN